MRPEVLVDALEAAADETTRTPPPTDAEMQRVLTATREITRWCNGIADPAGLCEHCGTMLRRGAHRPGCTPAMRSIVWIAGCVRLARWHLRRLWTS